MKAIATAVSTALALGVLASPALASEQKTAKHYKYYNLTKPYPYATERQRRNSLAFENGGYFEYIQSEHAFGSRSWWLLQNRGGGGRR
ncbi:MAG: hypothetical protein NW223_10960 [Hyphomicrobiaceae bacterium]|nr:hypothetical protein [Hyphomicrobiaceae bacterium]